MDLVIYEPLINELFINKNLNIHVEMISQTAYPVVCTNW